ncbi:MAG: type II secretion protein, partial [Syntrophobacteraceae bacterium]
VEVEEVLRYDLGIPRRKLLEALASHYRCDWVEYDERLPVPPELLAGLDPERLCLNLWFPVALDEDTVVIAARDPGDPLLVEEVAGCFKAEKFRFHVALVEDVAYFIEDFLNSDPSHLTGNERTALALWRNTMARWRTKLAGYRTDFAKVRTQLSLLRGGLTMMIIGRTLLRNGRAMHLAPIYWAMIATGLLLIFVGLLSYFRVKKSIFRPPRHQTLVEVTAASLYFLENYQFVERGNPGGQDGKTMLARLSDMAHRTVTVIEPSYDNKPRSQLAHERNLFAAQRTIAACYRAIYSRARTGLSFIRTGVSFASVGVGLITYFGLSMLNIVDGFIILAGLLLVVDGIVWSWPVRKENYEALKCAVAF